MGLDNLCELDVGLPFEAWWRAATHTHTRFRNEKASKNFTQLKIPFKCRPEVNEYVRNSGNAVGQTYRTYVRGDGKTFRSLKQARLAGYTQ